MNSEVLQFACKLTLPWAESLSLYLFETKTVVSEKWWKQLSFHTHSLPYIISDVHDDFVQPTTKQHRASGLYKNFPEWWVLAWLSDWSEVQTCIWPSWCHCHSMPLASVKTFLVPAHLGSCAVKELLHVCNVKKIISNYSSAGTV